VLVLNKEIDAIEARKATGRDLNRAERVELRRLRHAVRRIVRPDLLHEHAAEIVEYADRLRYACGLIARGRRPFCGVNGILLLIPMAATEDDRDAHETGTCCLEDLNTAREALRVECPVFALVCGLEQLPGYDAFLGQPRGTPSNRVGQRFPLAPDLRPDELPAMIKSGLEWLGQRSLPSLALPHWKLESPNAMDWAEAVRQNGELFGFLAAIRERQGRIGQILSRGVARSMFGGCYLAGTGRDPARDQAFLRGVFARLGEEQDFVSWTPEALAEEESYHRMTRNGYRILGVTVTALVLGLAFTIYRLTR
jgi:hypothetical protein